MRNTLKIIGITMCLLLSFYSCLKDESIHTSSSVILDKLLFSGYTGDTIKATVTYGSTDIKKLVITKWIDGVQVSGYETDITVNDISDIYSFKEEISVGDDEGTLVYTFSGYNASGTLVDASDLAVSVTLTDFGRCCKFDWRLTEQTVNGDITTTQDMLDNVYRFNNDFVWEYDWGASGPVNFEDLNQYCAWKYIGTNLKADSIYLVKFGFLATTPTIEKYKVVRLDDTNLWIQTFMDLSWLGAPYTAETPVVEKYAAIPQSSDFTPYRGANPANYNWGPCTPGEY